MSYLASFPSVKVLNSCIYLCTFFIFTIKYTQTISTSLRFIYACVRCYLKPFWCLFAEVRTRMSHAKLIFVYID